jgi:hypothetical protein
MDGTHHEVDGKVYPKCYNCHGTNPDTDPSWDPTNVYLIRMCENCHDVYTLHAITEHTTDGYSVYQSGGAIRAITANEKCVACHSDNQGQLPTLPTEVPVIWYAEPSQISPGGIVTLYHVAPPALGSDFGAKQDADKVQIGQDPDGAGPLPIAWVDVPVYSWTEDRVQFVVPGWTFQPLPTASGVRVVKQTGVTAGGDPITSNSNVVSLGIRKHPEIDSLAPNSGGWGATVTVNGVGFFSNRESVGAANPAGKKYGYSTYVELNASNDKYRATVYSSGLSWTDTSIQFKVGPLYDTNYAQPVLPQNLYQGCWNVSVVTDYFQDDGDNVHLLATGAIDPGDTLLYREVSDPTCFTVTNQPKIFSVNPKVIVRGNTAIIYGTFFGPTKGTSSVVAGVGPREAEIIGDAKGDDDGICEPKRCASNLSVFCSVNADCAALDCTNVPPPLLAEACYGDGDGVCEPNLGEMCMLKTKKTLATLGWSNTKIKVRIPASAPALNPAYIQVIVPTASPTNSNLAPVKITLP